MCLSPGVEVNQEAAGEKAEEEMQPLPLLSGAELLVRRQQKLAERKRRIAELATAVIENPEENVSWWIYTKGVVCGLMRYYAKHLQHATVDSDSAVN